MPKKCLNVFNGCLAVVASFLGGAPGESDYTDGVKLKMLIPGLLLGSDSSSRLFAIVVYERCQDFLDGHWEKLHGQIQYRKPPVLKALTPMNEEGRMWQMVERERQVGDVGKMAKVLKRSFDPPPPALRVGPLVKYNDLLPRPGEPTNRDDPHSKPRPPLPMEMCAAGTTTPLKALDVYRKAALATRNRCRAAGPSGESFRVWCLYLALDDELAEKFAGLANNSVANLLSAAARDFMVARLGALVHKPSQLPDELGARPIGIGKCDLRFFTAPQVRDVT